MTSEKTAFTTLLLILFMLVTAGWTTSANCSWAGELRPMSQIAAGTSFGENPPDGWSNIILFVEGQLGSGDVSAASATVRRYAKMFNLVMLANVAKDEEGVYRLEKVAVGFSKKINGLNTVITTDTEEKLGAGLSFIARSVFKANEESLDQIKQVVRSANAVVFDAPTIMLHDDEHEEMMVRYLVWASHSTGRISTFVWLMDNAEDESDYKLVEPTVQMLPENMHENRVMNVKGDRFTFGIPSKDAFALVRIPQGRAIQVTPRLHAVAGLRSYDADSFTELLKSLTDAVQKTATRRDL